MLGERGLGKTIARQINQEAANLSLKKIQMLGTARGLAGEGEPFLIGNDIDCARLAGVRAPSKGHLALTVGWQVAEVGDGRKETGVEHGKRGPVLGNSTACR